MFGVTEEVTCVYNWRKSFHSLCCSPQWKILDRPVHFRTTTTLLNWH